MTPVSATKKHILIHTFGGGFRLLGRFVASLLSMSVPQSFAGITYKVLEGQCKHSKKQRRHARQIETSSGDGVACRLSEAGAALNA